jgi:hypothetical protein
VGKDGQVVSVLFEMSTIVDCCWNLLQTHMIE